MTDDLDGAPPAAQTRLFERHLAVRPDRRRSLAQFTAALRLARGADDPFALDAPEREAPQLDASQCDAPPDDLVAAVSAARSLTP